MKHLVVVAHPAVDSFTMELARTYVLELDKLGHGHRSHDLYRMGFNPVLAAHELLPIGADHPADADVTQAQNDIRVADVLTVIYPLWWLSMPAMMKGYIDRVFARGFAYESHSGVVHGFLSGKKSVLITISEAPLPLLEKSGDWKAVQALPLPNNTWRAFGPACGSIFPQARQLHGRRGRASAQDPPDNPSNGCRDRKPAMVA